MKKYFVFIKNELAEVFAYRGAVLLWMISNMLFLAVMIALWQASKSGQTIAGYTRPELTTYYVIGFFFQWITLWLPSYGVSDEIRTGEIAVNALIKPISYFWQKVSFEIGWHSLGGTLGLILTIFLCLVFNDQIVFYFSLERVLATTIAVILTTLVTFVMSFCTGLLAFWVSDIWAIDSLFWASRGFLGGAILPISFIPGFFLKLVEFLPFRYTFSFPVEVYLGKVMGWDFVISCLAAIFWIAFFLILYKLMWKWGRKRYASFGQ